MPGYIHHVQWSVASVADTAAKLGREYGMRVVAARSLPDSGEREVVLRSGAVTFLVSPARPALVTRPAPAHYPAISSGRPGLDTVFNICLEVGDVAGTHDSMVRCHV